VEKPENRPRRMSGTDSCWKMRLVWLRVSSQSEGTTSAL
jgi:hypothetical protein